MLKLNEIQPVATQIQYGHKFTMEHEETHNNRYLSLCAKTSRIGLYPLSLWPNILLFLLKSNFEALSEIKNNSTSLGLRA